MGDLTDSLARSSPFEISPTPATSSAAARNPRPMPMRDDCWSEDATFTLIEAWGKHYLDLHRGNLRQKHWQEVSDAVNANHAGFNEKARRTDVQCKNRIDTLKKKYKSEKARVLDSNGSYQSNWPFFSPLDSLIGSSPSALKTPSPASISHSSFYPTAASVALQAYEMVGARAGPPMAVPLLPLRSTPPPAGLATLVPQKRPLPVATPVAAEYTNIRNYHSTVAAEYPNIRINHSTMATEYPDIRNNYSTVAAAAAAAASDEEEEEDAEEEEVEEDFNEPRAKRDQEDPGGLRRLATAIESFAGVYARVEAEKQRQMVELEKQRMQFAKELECQRMQMLVEMQVQLQKVKRVKR